MNSHHQPSLSRESLDRSSCSFSVKPPQLTEAAADLIISQPAEQVVRLGKTPWRYFHIQVISRTQTVSDSFDYLMLMDDIRC